MRVAFVINARNKGKHVYKAVESALAQTYPCEVIVSVQESNDNTYAECERAIAECAQGEEHIVRLIECPIGGEYSMSGCNRHFDYAWRQAADDTEWIFQLSADDYSLPDRVKACMEAVDANPCSAVATTMWFENPETGERGLSGYPTVSGYVKPSEGLVRLAYGSVIAAYSREFLEKYSTRVENHTMDVFFGYLAALEKGFYVVADPQHVHVQHSSLDNMGFQGKMLAATGDESLRLAELNHFQLMDVYNHCAQVAAESHTEIQVDDWNPLLNIIFAQARGWLGARKVLHQNKIMPGIIP